MYFKNWFLFEGILNKKETFIRLLSSTVFAGLITAVIVPQASQYRGSAFFYPLLIFPVLLIIICAWANLATAIRRLKTIGQSPYWVALLLINTKGIGPIVLLIMLFALPERTSK